MIRIRCSILEQVRKNPATYGQFLATSDKIGGGSHGMFQYWQESAVKISSEEIALNVAMKQLRQSFFGFAENEKNLSKQEFLSDQLVRYDQEFRKKKFEFVSSKKRMTWAITQEAFLTGLTPLIVKDKSSFFSYFFTEQPFDWSSELRFPLLQSYIAKNILEVDPANLSIGIYCLSQKSFDFKSFSENQIKKSFVETEKIFEQVYTEYSKKKKPLA